MNLGPISLDHYFVTELSVVARKSYDQEKKIEARPEEFEAKCDILKISTEDDKDLWQLTLEVAQQPSPESNFPYEFKVFIVGFVECLLKQEDEEERKRVVKINGASMLYGIVREIVRANTSRGPFEPIMIPTVSFYESSKVSEENSEE